MWRRLWPILFVFLGGCGTFTYHGPNRYSVGGPVAQAATIYLRNDAKMAADGNVYHFPYLAMTNTNSTATNDPTVQAYNAVLANNTWPYKRMHLDLSLDGGVTWRKRIGYGIQPGGPNGDFVWSPPEDYSLLTTNACVRLRTMAETAPYVHVGDGLPFDNPTNDPMVSPIFVIAGATITNHESVAFEWARDKNHPGFKALSSIMKEGQPTG